MQLILPADIVALLAPFAPLFSQPVWRHVQTLLVGAILSPGQRTVSSALRAVGLPHLRTFQAYHRVLSRAVWSSRAASRLLLRMLVATFTPEGPLVLGIDETIERRRGAKITAAGIYRDPVRSSHSHARQGAGTALDLPHAARPGAVGDTRVGLALSERAGPLRARGPTAAPPVQTPHDLGTADDSPSASLAAGPRARRGGEWGDRTYAALELLDAVRAVATLVTRLRLDARLFAPPPPRVPHQKGRPRLVGERLPNLTDHLQDPQALWTTLTVPHWYSESNRLVEVLSQTAIWYSTGFPPVPIRWVLVRDPRGSFRTQALLCTDLDTEPLQILAWFVRRWQLEVTFHEVRTHLGVETQRQWTERAILRTTPALLGLFSLVTLQAHAALSHASPEIRQSVWYAKPAPTFTDALAVVRRHLWTHTTFCGLPSTADLVKMPRALVDHLAGLLCYAA